MSTSNKSNTFFFRKSTLLTFDVTYLNCCMRLCVLINEIPQSQRRHCPKTKNKHKLQRSQRSSRNYSLAQLLLLVCHRSWVFTRLHFRSPYVVYEIAIFLILEIEGKWRKQEGFFICIYFFAWLKCRFLKNIHEIIIRFTYGVSYPALLYYAEIC